VAVALQRKGTLHPRSNQGPFDSGGKKVKTGVGLEFPEVGEGFGRSIGGGKREGDGKGLRCELIADLSFQKGKKGKKGNNSVTPNAHHDEGQKDLRRNAFRGREGEGG